MASAAGSRDGAILMIDHAFAAGFMTLISHLAKPCGKDYMLTDDGRLEMLEWISSNFTRPDQTR
jgi:hypothetical protein